MAAVDLSARQRFPLSRRVASVGTTWQEIKLPTSPSCRAVSVLLSAAGKIAFTGDDSSSDPADGGAVGTHYQPIVANAWMSWKLGPASPMRPTSLFVAADAGTLTATVSLEG